MGGIDSIKTEQTAPAKAAKQAGVKLFVPSEFGMSTPDLPREGFLAVKPEFQDALREIGVPYALFYTGNWLDWVFRPIFGWDSANGRVAIPGDGNAPMSATSRTDASRYVVHVLTHLPRDQLEGKTFRVEADRKTWNEILQLYQSKTGRIMQATYKPVSKLQAALKWDSREFADIANIIFLQTALGRGVVGQPGENDNDLFPDWNPSKYVDFM
ncbi:hypothetical protein OE88DRAFT_1654953 [Heliocybe sulcata]|uniref:NmrA-like domain-containing protein n=1 Tax=Heliocybe sulcata TaxID=5364 RepID=A0A5C3NAI1_9AGAM|nr:hypothetical protein OE88DRAFT_1654953 [Heliocybe sulcata]